MKLFAEIEVIEDWHWTALNASALAFTGKAIISICLFSVSSSAIHPFWRALM